MFFHLGAYYDKVWAAKRAGVDVGSNMERQCEIFVSLGFSLPCDKELEYTLSTSVTASRECSGAVTSATCTHFYLTRGGLWWYASALRH